MNSMFRLSMLAVGVCLLVSNLSFGAETATFAKDVAPILQEKCQECHHAGSMAPMSLVSYEEVRPWAKAIRERVITRQMPPWHIDPTVGVQKFKNDMSLNQAQIDTIVHWVDQGAPLGDRKDMPAPRQWANAGRRSVQRPPPHRPRFAPSGATASAPRASHSPSCASSIAA